MLAAQLAALLDGAPAGVDDCLTLVDGLDDALGHGLARLAGPQTTALTALVEATAGSPLGERAAEAADKLTAGSVAGEHLATLAGVRAAVLGAVHDALLARLDAALGRTRAGWAPAAEPEPPVGHDNLLAGCRSWLDELAITGWRGVDHDLVSGATQTIEAVLAQPSLRRLAVLLDGLAGELRACCPVATVGRLPSRRWADLWTRARLLSQAGGWTGGPVGTVSGRLLILGADVHEHATAVQVQVHALLETSGGEPPRLVRTGVAVSKVDTIVGPALWQLLAGHPVLLGALAGGRSLEVTDLPLLDSGDLLWRDGLARPGEPVDAFAAARVLLAGAVAPAVPPLDRHPTRIAEPVLLEGYTATGGDGTPLTLDLDGSAVEVDHDRLPGCGPLTPELVAASNACLGLVRWDAGRWLLQPLAVQTTVKRRTVVVHTGDWALGATDPRVVRAQARTGDAVAVLRERAGRLLRR